MAGGPGRAMWAATVTGTGLPAPASRGAWHGAPSGQSPVCEAAASHGEAGTRLFRRETAALSLERLEGLLPASPAVCSGWSGGSGDEHGASGLGSSVQECLPVYSLGAPVPRAHPPCVERSSVCSGRGAGAPPQHMAGAHVPPPVSGSPVPALLGHAVGAAMRSVTWSPAPHHAGSAPSKRPGPLGRMLG